MLDKILFWLPLGVGLFYALVTGAMVLFVSVTSLAIAFKATNELLGLCIQEAAVINLVPAVKNVCMNVSAAAYTDLVKTVVADTKAMLLYNMTKI
jgi:hypothetical protein